MLDEPDTTHDNVPGAPWLHLDARTHSTPGPTPYEVVRSSGIFSITLPTLPTGATPVSAKLYLAPQYVGVEEQYVYAREITTPQPRETSVTWNQPWQAPGAYGKNDVEPCWSCGIKVNRESTGNIEDVPYYGWDVLPIILKGVTTLKVKLEPRCTPGGSTNSCSSYTTWYSKESNVGQPYLEIKYAGGTPPANTATPTTTPTLPPTTTPTVVQTRLSTANTPIPGSGIILSEVLPTALQDWNGDGVVNERDRFVEVCNYTGATVNLAGYYVTFNDLASDTLTGTVADDECFVLWYELSGRNFKPLATGGTLKIYGPTGIKDQYTYGPNAGGYSWARYPDGGSTWVLQRPSPGEWNGYWLVNNTPTATPTRTPTPTP